MNDQRNLILAMLLSIGVLIGFDFLWIKPQQRIAEQAAQAQLAAQQQNAPSGSLDTPGVAAPTVAPKVSRSDALNIAGRVPFNAPEIDGSISLLGARIDDLHLKNYRETIDKTSPEVTLLNPQGVDGAYYAVLGWTEASANAATLPGPETLWTQISQGPLTPASPLKLQYATPDGLVFNRTITIDDHFMFNVTDSVTNSGNAPRVLVPYGVVRRHGIPPESGKNAIVFEGLIGVFENKLFERKYKDLVKGTKDVKAATTGGWLGVSDHYWLTALIPGNTEKFDAEMTVKTLANVSIFEANYLGGSKTLAVDATIIEETKVYSGAKRVDQLNAYKKAFDIPSFEKAVDWGNFWFFTKPLFTLLSFFEKLVNNFGIAILMLTVVVKAIFFPLVNQSYVAMSKMRLLQPKIEEIKKKYGKDPQKMQQETMAMYAKEKVNPLAGCLPMLIPVPVFYALYKTLTVTIEMRHTPFFGWIKDLSAKDPSNMFNLFGLLPFDPTALPLLGPLLAIGVLPLLYGFTMWILQSLSPPAPDPIQRQVIGLMPILFTVMFASFASGLVIYWTWSNILSIAQQYVIMRRMGTETEFDKWLAARRGKPTAANK